MKFKRMAAGEQFSAAIVLLEDRVFRVIPVIFIP